MLSQVSSTSISNMALRHLGATKPIADIETEASSEASACRVFYPLCIEESQRDFAFYFTTRIAALALVEEDPNDEWAYSYRYPSDCMMFKRILSGTRNDSRQSKVPYKLIQDDEGTLILTDKEDAECEFSKLNDSPQGLPRDYIMAVSFLLASYIAPSVTKGGDAAKLGELAGARYLASIEKARANSLNEQQDELPPQAEHIRARGGADDES